MTFPHDDPEFDDLLSITARERGIPVAMVEKDYWVTHSLWALEAQGFDVWFKGGTSLSKGFGLIERFSEDLDLRVEPGRVAGLPPITSWNKDSSGAIASRQAHFRAIGEALVVPAARVELLEPMPSAKWRGADYAVRYPGQHLGELDSVLSPYVLLEVGRARVTPAVRTPMTSFVHQALAGRDLLDAYEDNRPQAVRCVHPLVTLLEKLDALQKKVLDVAVAPARFVRHFEDVARIIDAVESSRLPPLPEYPDVRALAEAMLVDKSIARVPTVNDRAFAPTHDVRWQDVRAAHRAIGPMFWGARLSIDESCERIRRWLSTTLIA